MGGGGVSRTCVVAAGSIHPSIIIMHAWPGLHAAAAEFPSRLKLVEFCGARCRRARNCGAPQPPKALAHTATTTGGRGDHLLPHTKMLRAHTGTKPKTPIDGVRRHWAAAPATGSPPCSSHHASVAHTATTRPSSHTSDVLDRTISTPVLSWPCDRDRRRHRRSRCPPTLPTHTSTCS